MTSVQPVRASGRNTRYIATVILAALAGWIDAVSFVRWNGLYVSFMSGNTTSLAVSVATHDWLEAMRRASILLAFVFGVACGVLLGVAAQKRRAQFVPMGEAAVLMIAAVLSQLSISAAFVPLLLAVAMGMQNEALRRTGHYSIALTYVTGTIVRFGRGLASASSGTGSWEHILPYLGVWFAFLAGALAGGVAAGMSGAGAILLPALLLLIFAIWNPNKPIALPRRPERSR